MIERRKFIEIVPTYPLPVPIYKKEDYFTWPVKLMKANGYEVEIFTLRKRDQKKYESLKGIKIRRFGNFLQLFLSLSKEKNAVIYSQGKYFPILTSLVSKKAIYVPHGSFGEILPKYLRNSLLRKIWRLLFNKYYKVIAITQYELRTYKKLKFTDNIVFIPNLIDYDFFSKRITDNKFKCQYNIHKPVITFVGNIHGHVKNIDVLIKAFNLIKKRFKKVKLLIIGKVIDNDRNTREVLKKIKKDPQIVTTGWLNHKEIRKALSISSVFVNSSSNEGHSLAVSEAAAAGIPLCLSKIGSFVTTFKNTALYHRPNDYKTLAKNILYYLNNIEVGNKDAEINQLYVRNNFHPSVVMKKMKNLLIDDKKKK